MQHIIKLAPKRVVTTFPVTRQRLPGIASITQRRLLEIQRLAMLDMFPHTGHLESMVLFEHI